MRYPKEVRDRAREMYANGLSMSGISKRLDVSLQTVSRWVGPTAQAAQEAWWRRARKDPKLLANRAAVLRRHARKRKESDYLPMAERVLDHARHANRRHQYQQTAEYRRMVQDRKKKRRALDPTYRVLCCLRTRTNALLRGRTAKSARTEELLGCSVSELVEAWDERYGLGWRSDSDMHIDHIRPCISFDLTNPVQQSLCFNYRNLQLLPARENIKKGDTWTAEKEVEWVSMMRGTGWEDELFLAFAAPDDPTILVPPKPTPKKIA